MARRADMRFGRAMPQKRARRSPERVTAKSRFGGIQVSPKRGFQKTDEEGMEAGLIKRRSAPERGRGGGNRSKNRTGPLNRP
jgi:hypothetical protein